jgi:putative nucleotidyltransferase with HDIG domain
MFTSRPAKGVIWTVELLLLAGVIAAAVLFSRAEEWQPLKLVVLLLAITLTGQWLSVSARSVQLSASAVSLVLAMCLLGPAPAAAFGVAEMVITSALRKLSPVQWLNNLSTFALIPYAGGWTVRAIVGDVHDPRIAHVTHSVSFGLVVFGVFSATTALTYLLFTANIRVEEGPRPARHTRDLLWSLLPGEIATGALAAILAVAYTTSGLAVLVSSVVVLLIFQRLTVALLRSEDRADQLEARSIQLASLQFGVLATLMDALALRDPTSAQHATAVARYAKALAAEAGCDEAEQEVIHTAGLLHDIGKFTWPDRVLHPEQLTDQDMQVIHRHPQDGATLVGKLDGYGPVADAILYHHERLDGGGYPAGLIGNEIPLTSRIVAICSTYDAMTAAHSARPSMAPHEAMEELRRIGGRQLDGELVEHFITLLTREGETFGRRAGDSFETELAFERRVRTMAQPPGS